MYKSGCTAALPDDGPVSAETWSFLKILKHYLCALCRINF